MFKRIDKHEEKTLSFTFEGEPVKALEGDTVAGALLLKGESVFRQSAVSGENRAPYCLMGICFECLVEINGVPNRQACMVKVEDGMNVNRQKRAVEVKAP
ncbi:MAG: (2Fe-2S)-binding protein [Methylobacteriaceae bacterium]|jgi:predicted molibdopterin-dependent oxidoreductase YjgC|nr:(2Fe-2S)-binding protein [Methylobacteriaceae bacterium]